MAAVCGVVWTDPAASPAPDALERLGDALQQRGPASRAKLCRDFRPRPGYEPQPGVAMEVRAASAGDSATAPPLPTSEDGRIHVACDGAIYNVDPLRRRLEGSGHRFGGDDPHELLAHLYEDDGPGCAAHLNGDFAFALWDDKRRELVLCRDRFGLRPLVYCVQPSRVWFASDPRALVAALDERPMIEPRALDEYLAYGYVPHPWTLFRGIFKLPPGCYVVFRDGRTSLQRFWSPDFGRERSAASEEHLDELRARLHEAVRLRTRDGQATGLLATGGQAAFPLASRLASASDETVPLAIPCAVEQKRERKGETPPAATRFAVHPISVGLAEDPLEQLRQLADRLGEPCANLASLLTFDVLARHAAEHMQAAVSDLGGRELLGLHGRYRLARAAAWLEHLPLSLRRLLASRVGRPLQPGRAWRKLAPTLLLSSGRRYFEWVSACDEATRALVYDDAFIDQLPDSDPFEFLREALQRAGERNEAARASVADLVTELPCVQSLALDALCQSHGLTCRHPLLDPRAAELAIALPRRWWPRGVCRQLTGAAWKPLRQATRMLAARLPLAGWLRGPLGDVAREVLLDPTARQRGFFRGEAVERLLSEHASSADHTRPLVALLMLELHLRSMDC